MPATRRPSRRFARISTPLLRPQDEVEDFRDGRPEVGAAVANAERFLVLAALVSVLLGGVAVAMAARRFVARRLDAVALDEVPRRAAWRGAALERRCSS